MAANLNETAHRPWPLPAGAWVMAQSWHDLLFAHWPVPVSTLRALIPESIEIDTHAGTGWVGVVPFRMADVRLRGTPAMPWLSAFPELNVRTYVTAEGKAGVWFFSLDAGNAAAVAIAKKWFHLPYFRARMSCASQAGWIEYKSQRTHRGAAIGELEGHYRPTGPVLRAQTGSLEYFLTERYCLYTADANGRVIRGEIHHAPWPLQPAEAEFEKNTMTEAAGFRLPVEKPLLHFSRRLDVVVWSPQRLPA